jgi:hypothetical protein
MNVLRTLQVGLLARTLAGCGAGAGTSEQRTASSSVPAYVTEPFSHEQKLIAQGARLIVADGCSACHLMTGKSGLGPSFSSFAGHVVRLADGRKALVDEPFLRKGLEDPRAELLKGYDPAPMLAAVARLHLTDQPRQVAALAAFIEQVGPEP